MSIFSKIKSTKKAADEHKAAVASAAAAEAARPPPAKYRHVPSHAAQDALSGAPSAFQSKDREAIRLANKRRSMSRQSLHFTSSPVGSRLQSRNPSRDGSSQSGTTCWNDPSALSRPSLNARKSHLGYQGYEGFDMPRDKRQSRLGKSPLSTAQISPDDSSASSAASEPLEIRHPIKHVVGSVKPAVDQRQTPWEVASSQSASNAAPVLNQPKAQKRKRALFRLGRNQQAVAAC